MITRFKGLFIVICVAALVACAGMTVKQSYLAQRTAFNELLNQYTVWAVAQPEEVKAKLRKDVNPVIDEAASALNSYGQAIYLNNADPQSKLNFYLILKTKLLNAALKYGFHYQEGGVK